MDYGERALLESLKNSSEFIVIEVGLNFRKLLNLKGYCWKYCFGISFFCRRWIWND